MSDMRLLFVFVCAFCTALVLYHLGVVWQDWVLVLMLCVVLVGVESLCEILYDWWRS